MRRSRRRFVQTAVATAGAMIGGTGTGGEAAGGAAQSSVDSTLLRPKAPGESIIVCAGDLFLTQPLSSPSNPQTAAVYDVLRQADTALANLENGLSTRGSPDLGGFKFGPAIRGNPALAADLTWAGVRAVSLANNHTGNFGPDALLETIAALDSAGVQYAGAGRNVGEAFAPTFVRAGSLTVGLVSAYSFYYNFQALDIAGATPGIAACRAYDVLVGSGHGLDTTDRDKSPFLLRLANHPPQVVMASLKEDVDRLVAAVKTAASRADFTIVSTHFHWGRHGRHDLLLHKQALAHTAVDAGADLFVGHGPHTLRGMEWYRGKPIMYSLGNFVLRWNSSSPPVPPVAAGADPPPANRSVIARLAITRRRVTSLELLPIVIDGEGSPQFAAGRTGDRILAGMYGMSAMLGAELRFNDWFATSMES